MDIVLSFSFLYKKFGYINIFSYICIGKIFKRIKYGNEKC